MKIKGLFVKQAKRVRKQRDKRFFYLGVTAGCIGCAMLNTAVNKLGKLVAKVRG